MATAISNKKPVICLLGPTASGKTKLAMELVKSLPLSIVSVDSAMVYRGMDIGTAKPSAVELTEAPHRLIDFKDPKEAYSAGDFYRDALREINDIHAQGKLPLLVGGTMLYFRALIQGLAKLPPANPTVRKELKEWAEKTGWANLHAELTRIDPKAGERIHSSDTQRIQRALEVFLLTGRTITDWHTESRNALAHLQFHCLILAPSERQQLHAYIAARFKQMLDLGFVDEVRALYERPDLHKDLPAIRSVGYRQVWAYLAGELKFDEMQTQAIYATQQLAKRQMTWLRAWQDATWFDANAEELACDVMRRVNSMVG